MIKGFPCKVTDYSTAKPGKHGSSKASIVGVDIFTNNKYEDTCPTSANVLIPTVIKHDYEVADIAEDDFVSLILEDGSLKEDLKLPTDEELHDELKKIWNDNKDKGQVFFTLQRAVKQEKIIAGRVKENWLNENYDLIDSIYILALTLNAWLKTIKLLNRDGSAR